jgi:hypothetical protein
MSRLDRNRTYDVSAQAKNPTTAAQLRLMVETQLEDRFRLEGAEALAALTKEGTSPFNPGDSIWKRGIPIHPGNCGILAKVERSQVPWLIQTDLTSAGQLDRGCHSPRCLSDRPTCYLLRLQGADGLRQVVAHQIESCPKRFVARVCWREVSWVERDFGRRQRENQPPLMGVNPAKFQNIAEKRPIGFRIFAV